MDMDSEALEHRIIAYQGNSLKHALSGQHPVEGVTVFALPATCLLCVWDPHREFGEATSVDPTCHIHDKRIDTAQLPPSWAIGTSAS